MCFYCFVFMHSNVLVVFYISIPSYIQTLWIHSFTFKWNIFIKIFKQFVIAIKFYNTNLCALYIEITASNKCSDKARSFNRWLGKVFSLKLCRFLKPFGNRIRLLDWSALRHSKAEEKVNAKIVLFNFFRFQFTPDHPVAMVLAC